MGKKLNSKWLAVLACMLIRFYDLYILTQQARIEGMPPDRLWQQSQGIFYLWETVSLTKLLLPILPVIIIVSAFATVLSDDVVKNAQYIFVRTDKRSSWMVKKSSSLFVEYLKLRCVLIMFELVCIAIMSGGDTLAQIDIRLVAWGIISSIVCEYTLILFANSTALCFGELAGYVAAISVFMAGYITVCFGYQSGRQILWWLPFVQAKMPCGGVTVIGCMGVYLALVCGWSHYVVNRKEFY